MTSRESPKVTQLNNNVNNVKQAPDAALELVAQFAVEKKPVEISARTGKPKRRKAVRACTNCQRTHLTCDDDRPCERCVKRGCADTCVDGERKKPRRARTKSVGHNKSDMAQFVPDMLLAQGQMAPLDLTQQSHHLNQLSYNPSHHAQQQLQHPHAPNALLQHISHSTPTHNPASQPHQSLSHQQQHSLALANGFADLHSSVHSIDHSGQRGRQHSDPSSNDESNQQPAFESYRLLPDYFEPLDSYPLPSQPPLHGFASEIHGSSITTKDGSVISAMLHSRANAEGPDDGMSETRHSSDGSGAYETVSGSNDEESVNPRDQQAAIPWLEPTSNPLANAHNEHSRRFSYNYEHTDPSEVYRRVTEPYPNRKALHQMIEYLKKRLPSDEFKPLAACLTKLKNHFSSITRPLSSDDNLFVEQSFQRSLLEEEKQFALTPVPCLVWRRSGVVAAVSPRFSKLTQWAPEKLKSGFIFQVMNNESISRYFEKFQPSVLKISSDFKFDCVLSTPSGEEISTETEVTIRKDLFNMPLTIVGKFWVKS